MRRAPTEVLLDLLALDETAQVAWLAFVDFFGATVGVELSVERFSGLPPDARSNFAYLTDSAALTRKLLLNIPRIYIKPLAAPKRVDCYLYWKLLASGQIPALSLQPVLHTVTLISSVFRGDEFLEGFLANSAKLRGYRDCEHFLIRAASPENEHALLVQHVQDYPGAVYINLPLDPGLYEVWNLGVRLATGRYLSNANIDDRRAPEQLFVLQDVLSAHPEIDLASTALRVSTRKNLSWEESDTCQVMFENVGERVYAVDGLFAHTTTGLASRNLPHCMPLWRRSLHARLGCFNEKRYGPSADWAFWLRAGRRGARFHFSARPLGLYLRDKGTYWRRNTANGAFDTRIVEEFGDLVASKNKIPEHGVIPEMPLSQEISAVLALLRSGACLEGMGRLLYLAAAPLCRIDTAGELLTRVATKYFGCADWWALATRHTRMAGDCGQVDIALFNSLVDLVHEFEPKHLGSATAGVRRTLEFVCIDMVECSGDIRGLLLLALLARRQGELGVEQALLQYLHDEDATVFWSAVQSVYRFTRPLPDICAALRSIPPGYVSNPPPAKHNVIYFPAYKGNPYQNLLYTPLRAAGGQVFGTSDEKEFLSVPPLEGVENILHVHWISRLFEPLGTSRELIAQRAEIFLEGLARQRQRGHKVYWTIHNYLSHESADIAGELAFRKTLYQLADRVFVHHPLAAQLLDWLPDHDKLCLCEHGHYDIAAANRVSRAAAREALGLGPNDFVITHVGRLRDYKGLVSFLPLLAEMLTTFPRMKLVIAGPISSNKVKKWLARYKGSRLIVRDGFMSENELNLQMRAADLGFLSYNAILTSGTMFHWFTCGRPILAPLNGTIPAYLIDGWNGFGYRDADSLLKLVACCANLPEDFLVHMGNNAQATSLQLEWRMWKG